MGKGDAKKDAAKLIKQEAAAQKRQEKRDREAAADASVVPGAAAAAIAELTAEAKKKLWDAAEAAVQDMPDTTEDNADDRTSALYAKMKARQMERLTRDQ